MQGNFSHKRTYQLTKDCLGILWYHLLAKELWDSQDQHQGPPFIVKSQVSLVHILRQAAMKLFTAQGDSLLGQVPHVLMLPSDLLPCTQQWHLNLRALTVPYQISR